MSRKDRIVPIGEYNQRCGVCGNKTMLVAHDKTVNLKVGKCCLDDLCIADDALDKARQFGICHPSSATPYS